jgi:hypothetical protein
VGSWQEAPASLAAGRCEFILCITPTDADIVALYERRFAALAEVAAEMDIAPDDAAELIDDILLASLVKRPIEDVDAFLVAAFRAAVDYRKGHGS